MDHAIQKQFLQAILDSGYEEALIHILEPVLEELGNMWTVQKDVSFAQVYVSATIAEDIILKVFKNRKTSDVLESKGTIMRDDFPLLKKERRCALYSHQWGRGIKNDI